MFDEYPVLEGLDHRDGIPLVPEQGVRASSFEYLYDLLFVGLLDAEILKGIRVPFVAEPISLFGESLNLLGPVKDAVFCTLRLRTFSNLPYPKTWTVTNRSL